jgi:hypothetical protein
MHLCCKTATINPKGCQVTRLGTLPLGLNEPTGKAARDQGRPTQNSRR